MILVCENCKKEFIASSGQEKRARCPSLKPKFGHACSRTCGSLLGKRSVERQPPDLYARAKIGQAIRYGQIVRPETCSKCGNNPTPDRIGRSRIQAHHPDHSKPMEIEWLCYLCHRAITPSARGEKIRQSTLTELDVRRIRIEHSMGTDAHKLAKEYNVTANTIWHISSRKTWKHVT